MKKLTKTMLVATLVGFTAIQSCKKDNDETATPNNPSSSACKIDTLKVDGQLSSVYEYNTDGKLSKSYSYDGSTTPTSVSTYSYNGSTIVVTQVTSDTSTYTKTYIIGSKGYATSLIRNNGTDTTYYTQNNDGYLIKEETRYNITNYVISNGNTVSSISKSKLSADADTTTSTFYLDKTASGSFDVENFQGKADKNLIKTEVYKSNFSSFTDAFVWTITNGLATSAAITQIDNGVTSNYNFSISYKCK